jgi:transcriptional regulator with XRE-family HTH domain
MNNYKEDIGHRMKHYRKLHKYTQEQFAEKLDISIKHYSEAERGKTGLSLDNLIKVCDIFGISLDYLVRGRTSETVIPTRMVEIYSACPSDRKEYLMEIWENASKLYEV